MAFRLKRHESVNKGVKRIIRRQLGDAMTVLASGKSDAVHDVRVHFKKLRAGLHLMRGGLGDRLYRRENRCFRDAMKSLTKVRDAGILIETLDWLSLHFSTQFAAEDIVAIRTVLQERYQALRKRVLEKEHAFANVARTIDKAQERLKGWPMQQKGWAVLKGGLKRSYRANRRAVAEARRRPTVEHLHEWRKQAKYLWYQLLILKSAWPAGVKAWDRQFHKLTRALGDDHDLAVLRQTLTRDAGVFGQRIDALLPLIDRRRDELQKQAFGLEEKLYRDKPGAFMRRVEKRWKRWQSGR